MKRLLLGALLVVGSTVASARTTSPVPSPEPAVESTASAATLHVRPNNAASAVAKLQPATTLLVMEREPGWVRVTVAGTGEQGWVVADRIAPSHPNMLVAASTAELRAQPQSTANVIATLGHGEPLVKLKSMLGWVEVAVLGTGRHGWLAATAAVPQIPEQTERLTLQALTGQSTVKLRSSQGSAYIDFGVRADEVVTRAVLQLHYAHSPALIPRESHIKVVLNGETVGVVPITKDTPDTGATQSIVIDPRFLTDFNHLALKFIGHYTNECENPQNNTLWADVDGNSALELTTRRIPLRNDLSLLPVPFFDQRDRNRLTLPFVFAAHPSPQTLEAAAAVSSWFGALADWRGALFPADLDRLPAGDAVVFATNSERPAFLADYAPVKGPTIRMVTNPADGYSKLLLVLGRDGKDLREAAQTLTLGSAALSGSSALIRHVRDLLPRKPYDAPNWVRTDRPTKFGELIDSPQQLQVFGHQPGSIDLNLRVPPDLFTWRSRGVPVDLKFRYSPPVRQGESRLTVSVNDQLVQAFNLSSSGSGASAKRIRLPLLDDILFGGARQVFLPAFKLGARNKLQFSFSFPYQKRGRCQDTEVDNVRAMVDADSSVDFSGFPHYAKMPNLNYFATAGYPFTKYADLSHTVAVLPKQPDAAAIETLLTLTGRMGASTGYPAVRLRVASPGDTAQLKGADLLVIGTVAHQALLGKWQKELPADVAAATRSISLPVRNSEPLFNWLGFGTHPDPAVASRDTVTDGGPLAALLGFESPLSDGDSVVAVTATGPKQLSLALNALANPGLVRHMRGSVVFIHPDKVESYLVGPTYTVGHLPLWTAIWYPLSKHPVLLALLAVVAVLVFAFALWRTLRAVAAKRTGSDE